jgi:hypothetical protein
MNPMNSPCLYSTPHLSSRQKLYELNELYFQSLVRRYPSTDGRQLQPVNGIARDAVRAEIDTRLATGVLGFPPELVAPDGPLALLRQKLALEPSITGSKSAC